MLLARRTKEEPWDRRAAADAPLRGVLCCIVDGGVVPFNVHELVNLVGITLQLPGRCRCSRC